MVEHLTLEQEVLGLNPPSTDNFSRVPITSTGTVTIECYNSEFLFLLSYSPLGAQ